MTLEWHRGQYTISTDPSRVNVTLVHAFLSNESYWARGVPLEVVQRSIKHSLVFGIYKGRQQVGFARVVTDYATFAYLADVFILKDFRGQGLGTWLVEVILAHPKLQGLRRWMLATKDAHELYRKLGFSELSDPGRLMERCFPDIYGRGKRAEDA